LKAALAQAGLRDDSDGSMSPGHGDDWSQLNIQHSRTSQQHMNGFGRNGASSDYFSMGQRLGTEGEH
jgi:hypothetical protein